MSYIKFRGVSTASMANVVVVQMPSHKKAKMRYTQYEIPARNGDLHLLEGYASFDIQCALRLVKNDATARQTINAWADGTGDLVLSDDPTKCYKATVLGEVLWTRDTGNEKFYDTATITFHCQPFMKETTPSVYTFTQSGTIINLGDVDALPLIEVTGSGTCKFTVGGSEITLSGVSSSNHVFIDSEAGYVYTDGGMSTMVGEFPVIPLGTSAVTITSGVTNLKITPRWGWI